MRITKSDVGGFYTVPGMGPAARFSNWCGSARDWFMEFICWIFLHYVASSIVVLAAGLVLTFSADAMWPNGCIRLGITLAIAAIVFAIGHINRNIDVDDDDELF